MRHILPTLLLYCLGISAAFAQQDSASVWKRTGSFTLTFTNVQLSNWAAGGQNAIALGGILDLKAVRETAKSKWDNQFRLQLGGARVGDANNLFKKTDDFLQMSSQYTYKWQSKWGVSAGADLRTQTLPGHDFFKDATGQERRGKLLSDFFAPAFLTTNLGITYTDKIFTATFSPISNRITFVMNDSLSAAGAFGVQPGKRVLLELGPNLVAKLDVNIWENVNLKSAFTAFAKYDTLDRIDVTWETLLTFKVNKYLTTSFGTNLLYYNNVLFTDPDGSQKPKVQFKQVLSVNFGVQF